MAQAQATKAREKCSELTTDIGMQVWKGDGMRVSVCFYGIVSDVWESVSYEINILFD